MSKRNRKSHQVTKPNSSGIKSVTTLVDVIIPVYGRFDILPQCIDSIPDAVGGLPHNIILVDNNSPEKELADQFYRDVQANIPNLFVVRNKENAGFPVACNQGAKRKYSPLLFFLNSDVILKENAIRNMVMDMDDPKIGVVGMKLLFPDIAKGLKQDTQIRPAGKVQHVGLCTNIRGDFYHVFVGWSPEHPKVMAVREVYAVTGAALMTRRALFDKVGGFNPIYGLGTFEDVDYCLSVRELGYNVIVEQSAVGIHYTGATAEHYQLPYPMNQNHFIFMAKWANQLNYTESNHL